MSYCIYLVHMTVMTVVGQYASYRVDISQVTSPSHSALCCADGALNTALSAQLRSSPNFNQCQHLGLVEIQAVHQTI